MEKPENFEQYLQNCPENAQEALIQIHEAVLRIAPDAIPVMSYGMPAFKLNKKILLYFAGWKNHIGLYPLTTTLKGPLQAEIAHLKTSKGSIQFPLKDPMPMELIEKIIAFRVAESRSLVK